MFATPRIALALFACAALSAGCNRTDSTDVTTTAPEHAHSSETPPAAEATLPTTSPATERAEPAAQAATEDDVLATAHETSPLVALPPADTGDWPMFGRTPARNMVGGAKRPLPVEWDVDSGKNMRWRVELGDSSYGNPVLADGRVLVGTNNARPRDLSVEGDRGVIMCFAAADGAFLWQATHEKLPEGDAVDFAHVGICSSPAVDADRVYYLSNRGELICADLLGFADEENDGTVQDEEQRELRSADLVWRFDMVEQLGVVPHNMTASNPLVIGDMVYALTSNGVAEDHVTIPAPESAGIVALDKYSGDLVWAEGSVEGIWHHVRLATLLHGQWASPGFGEIEHLDGSRQALIFYPAGDGWLYALRPDNGELVWKYDCNPKDAQWLGMGRGERNELIATPVFVAGRVFIATGQDPEHGGGPGGLHCIDAAGQGDITELGRVWSRTGIEFGRSVSTVAVADGLLFAAELDGFLHCLEAHTGEELWQYDALAEIWGSPLVADGKVYIGDSDGDVAVLEVSREMQLLAENNVGESIFGSLISADGVLYLATTDSLMAMALQNDDHATTVDVE